MLITNIMKRLEYHKPVFFYTEEIICGDFLWHLFQEH